MAEDKIISNKIANHNDEQNGGIFVDNEDQNIKEIEVVQKMIKEREEKLQEKR